MIKAGQWLTSWAPGLPFEIPLLNFRKNERICHLTGWTAEPRFCTWEVFALDIRAMQQEHSFPIFWRCCFWLPLQSRWVPLCRACRHSASLAAEYHPIHQHPPGRGPPLRSHRSGEATRLITSRAVISSAAALRRLQPIWPSHYYMAYGWNFEIVEEWILDKLKAVALLSFQFLFY